MGELFDYWDVTLTKKTHADKLGVGVDLSKIDAIRFLEVRMHSFFPGLIAEYNRNAKERRLITNGDEIVAVDAIFGHNQDMAAKIRCMPQDKPFKLTIRSKK